MLFRSKGPTIEVGRLTIKPTQNRDHYAAEKQAIESFLLEKIPAEQKQVKAIQHFKTQLLFILEDYLQDTSHHLDLLESKEESWNAFFLFVLSKVANPIWTGPITDLFKTEPGKELLQNLFEKAHRYHHSSREDFKQEFHT